MTPKQESLYWREWGAVHKTDPSLDRHELHAETLGRDTSHKLFTNEQFDKVLGAFRAISRPSNLDAQLRQLRQQKTRLLWKIEQEQSQLLALYLKPGADSVSPSPGGEGRGEGGPFAYITAICRDQFRAELGQLDPPQLENLRSTLAARINQFRRQAGHTIHDMHCLAGLKCPCSKCGGRRSLSTSSTPSTSSIPEPQQPAPKISDAELARIIAALTGAGWRTAEQLATILIYKDRGEAAKRRIRAIANASAGRILSYPGSPGYKLTKEATIAEIQSATAKLRHQALEMLQRALQIDRVYHGKL